VSPRSARRAHEIPVNRGVGATWVVTSGRRTLSRHRTQRTAVARDARAARRAHVDLVIHGRNGRIRAKDSYGPESARRDTEQ
jgi:hypothetical protein